MKDELEVVLALLSLVTAFGGGYAWIRSTNYKKFAAEREFTHIRRNQEQAAQSFALLHNELEETNKILLEQKFLTQAMQSRIEIIAAKLDITTSGWSNRPDR